MLDVTGGECKRVCALKATREQRLIITDANASLAADDDDDIALIKQETGRRPLYGVIAETGWHRKLEWLVGRVGCKVTTHAFWVSLPHTYTCLPMFFSTTVHCQHTTVHW